MEKQINEDKNSRFSLWYQEHISLIWSVVHKYTFDQNDLEDMFQEASIACFNAFNKFDIERGAEDSTFYYKCMTNALKMKLRQKTAAKRGFEKKIFSIEGHFSFIKERFADSLEFTGPVLQYSEPWILADKKEEIDLEKLVDQRDLLKQIQKNLSEEEYKIIWYYGLGYSQQEISSKINRSQSLVSTCITKIKKKFSQEVSAALA